MDRFPDGVGVNRDDGLDVGTVSAAHRDRDGDVAIAAGVKDEAIAGAQALDGHLEAAQSIAFERIGAREIEHDIRTMGVQHPRQMCRKCRQVLIVPAPSSKVTSRSLVSLRNGKFLAPCRENVKTAGWSRKMAAVPLP